MSQQDIDGATPPNGEDVDPERSWQRDFLDAFTEAVEPFQSHEVIPVWDEYFHAIAQTVALRSRDQSRKVGAVIVSGCEGRVVLSTGFNWFPRGVRELAERTATKDHRNKYAWITHAETNAIFNAARRGISLEGATIYTTTFPCSSCAQAIVQAGIRRVFTYGEYWKKDPSGWAKGVDMLGEAGIVIDAPRIRGETAGLWNKRWKDEDEEAEASVTRASRPQSIGPNGRVGTKKKPPRDDKSARTRNTSPIK
jgi:dCMP deaminase